MTIIFRLHTLPNQGRFHQIQEQSQLHFQDHKLAAWAPRCWISIKHKCSALSGLDLPSNIHSSIHQPSWIASQVQNESFNTLVSKIQDCLLHVRGCFVTEVGQPDISKILACFIYFVIVDWAQFHKFPATNADSSLFHRCRQTATTIQITGQNRRPTAFDTCTKGIKLYSSWLSLAGIKTHHTAVQVGQDYFSTIMVWLVLQDQ